MQIQLSKQLQIQIQIQISSELMQINQAASEQNRVADDGGKDAGATVPSGKLSSIKLPFPFLEKPLTHFSARRSTPSTRSRAI